MKVVAFLPAKGTSSRVDNKNIKLLDGKPLFLHSLEKLTECEFIDEVYLDTESDDIIELASEVDCKVLKRDPSLANNKTDGHQLFMNEVHQVEADIYIQILCTSPFIEKETLRQGVHQLIESAEHDSAVLVREERQYLWKDGKPTYDIDRIPNSNELAPNVIETMGLYMVKRDAALNLKKRIGLTPFILKASPTEAIDVNYPEDFELADLIAAGKRAAKRKLLNNIKTHLTSSMLSDIMDDLGIPGVIRGPRPNIDSVKIFGRAKTLRLRELKEGENFKGIYEALHTYETIVPNDIIVVENEVSQYAYFGELNANLAIRSGASGAIIGGMTRDTAEVKNLGFPVFAAGSTCKDVRKRATVDHYNKTIEIEGIKISPEDLIFGDRDGVIVIPKKHEDKVLQTAFDIIRNEKSLLIEISKGKGILDLTKDHGFF